MSVLSMNMSAQTVKWSTFFQQSEIFSSPRATDLNQNGVKDVVIGGGIEGVYSPYIIMALDGLTGDTLWSHDGIEHLFSDPVFADVTGDGIPNVFLAGRGASLFCLNGETGEILWRYSDCLGETSCLDTLPNIYSPKILPDISGNGFPDLLITKGGYPPAGPGNPDRPPGYLMILEGNTGNKIVSSVAPDSFEIYASPMIIQLTEHGPEWIFFGTGGETLPGSVWAITLNDFANGQNNFTQVVTSMEKGFIGPVSFADLNHDGILDIICVNFGGEVIAIDGNNFQQIWKKSFPGYESYSNPTIGFFNQDDTPDIAVKIYKGQWPQYQNFEKVILNGNDGTVLRRRAMGYFNMNSSLAYRNTSNTYDVLIYTNNDTSSGKHNLIVYSFDPVTNDSTTLITFENDYVFAASPLLEDLNENGFLELIIVHNTEHESWPTSKVTVIETDIPTINKTWGGYMGSLHDGVFYNDIISSSQIAEKQIKNQFSVQKLTNQTYRVIDQSPELNRSMFNLYDNSGRLVLSLPFYTEVEINLKHYARGSYFYQISQGFNSVQSGVLINHHH